MIYSYTQISQYLRCPRSYRYRYLDGWREKDTRAAMVFGRCFEKALRSFFEHEDCSAILFKEWGAFRTRPLNPQRRVLGRLVHQGVHLLQKFAQDGAFTFRILKRTCSVSSLGRLREEMSCFLH